MAGLFFGSRGDAGCPVLLGWGSFGMDPTEPPHGEWFVHLPGAEAPSSAGRVDWPGRDGGDPAVRAEMLARIELIANKVALYKAAELSPGQTHMTFSLAEPSEISTWQALNNFRRLKRVGDALSSPDLMALLRAIPYSPIVQLREIHIAP